MEFKGQYLSYDEYKELKGTLEQVPFNLLEYEIRKMIDERTFGRLKDIKSIPYEVKMCVFKMLEIKQSYQALREQNKTLVSVNTDGYSESYKRLEETDLKTEGLELKNTIETYLANVIVDNTPVLYLGVD